MMIPEQKKTQGTAVPYWIPRDVYCPVSSSLRSSCIKQSGVDQNNHSDETVGDTDGNSVGSRSSVMSLSTTSDLTDHSAVGVPKTTDFRESTGQDIHDYAVESAYNDLENADDDHDDNNWWPPSSAQVFFGSQPFPSEVHDETGDDDEPFDPFLLGSSCPSISEYCRNSEQAYYDNDGRTGTEHDCGESDTDDRRHLLEALVSNNNFLFSENPMNDDYVNNPTNQSGSLRRRYSDFGVYSRKTKQKIFIPLHTRMEMIGHQSQKPFRKVSNIVVCSIQWINDMIRPGFRHTNKFSNATRNRFSLYRRRRNKNVLLSSVEDDGGSTASLPDLRNITSLDSSESSSTFFQHKSWTSQGIGMETGDVAAPEIRPFPERSLSGRYGEEDDDLRWLFARQQLPLTTVVQCSPSFGEKSGPLIE